MGHAVCFCSDSCSLDLSYCHLSEDRRAANIYCVASEMVVIENLGKKRKIKVKQTVD